MRGWLRGLTDQGINRSYQRLKSDLKAGRLGKGSGWSIARFDPVTPCGIQWDVALGVDAIGALELLGHRPNLRVTQIQHATPLEPIGLRPCHPVGNIPSCRRTAGL